MSKINIIVAVTKNMVIGKGNDMPWHLPTDLKNFKRVTQGACVVMGRKCWESIPAKFRPLPNRDNFVLTRNTDYVAEGASIVHSLEEAINKFKHSKKTLFIIGGAEIYKEAFKHANSMFLTDIYNHVEGDIFLEGLDFKEWHLTEFGCLVKENGFDYSIKHYEKKK